MLTVPEFISVLRQLYCQCPVSNSLSVIKL